MKAQTANSKVFMRKDRITFNLFLAPSFIVLFLLTVVPLIFSVVIALTDYNLIRPNTIRFVWLDNFVRAIGDKSFLNSVRVSLIQVIATVGGQMVVGMTVALLLAREFKGIRIMRAVYVIPMMITPVVSGIMWRMIFNTDLGIVNYFLSVAGVNPINWLGEGSLALLTVILTDIMISTPFVTTILLAGIQSISSDYYDAAHVDGASSLQRFVYIVLPLVKPMILLALLFRVMDAIRRFDSIMAMTAGGPGNATETLNLYAYYQGFSYFNIGYSSALSFIMLVIIFTLSIILLNRIQAAND